MPSLIRPGGVGAAAGAVAGSVTPAAPSADAARNERREMLMTAPNLASARPDTISEK